MIIIKRSRYICLSVFLFLIVVFTARISNFTFVCNVESFQYTLIEQRANDDSIERTALAEKIIDTNKKIIIHKVIANLPVLRIFYIDSFRSLDLIN